MKHIAAAVLTAVFAGTLTGIAGAVPVTAIQQPAAPVRLQSCSVTALNDNSTPVYGRGETATLMDSSGHIVYAGSAVPYDQQIPMTPMYDSTRVYAAAHSVNVSNKSISGVVYEFAVSNSKHQPLSVFYGAREGAFGANASIAPYGEGTLSPWSAALTQPDVGYATCFVAYVRYSDGTSWRSGLAITPPR